MVDGDGGPSLLEGLPKGGRRRRQGLVERRRTDRQLVDYDAVEALGVLAQGGVAPLLDLGQDLPHGLDRRGAAQVGPGQTATDVGAAAAKVEAGEHQTMVGANRSGDA